MNKQFSSILHKPKEKNYMLIPMPMPRKHFESPVMKENYYQ